MKRIKTLIKIFLFNKRSLIAFILLTLIFALPFTIHYMSNGFVDFCETETKKIYGFFDNILYEGGLEDIDLSQTGISSISEFVDKSGEIDVYYAGGDFVIGYADNSAIDLGNIGLIDGGFPEADNEVVICESLLYECFYNSKVGDQIEIAGNKYVLVGIINDYSVMWNKSQWTDLKYPNVLAKSKAEDHIQAKITLIKNHISFPVSMYETNKNLVVNSNAIENNSGNRYIAPDFVYITCYLSILILDLYILFFLYKKDHYVCEQLTNLACGERLSIIVVIRNILLCVVSIFSGCMVSRLIARHIFAYYNSKYSTNIVFNEAGFPILHLATSLVVVTFVIAILISLNVQKRKSKKSRVNRINTKNIFRKDTVHTIMITVILITMMFVCIVVFSLYLQMYIATKADVFGKMPIDYDYQFLTDLEFADYSYVDSSGELVSVFSLPSDDTKYTMPNHDSIISDLVLSDMEQEEGVSSVNTFYEANDVYLNVPSINQSYLDGFPVDLILDSEVKQELGVKGHFRCCQFYGLPLSELERLSAYIREGNLNIDKICSGEEIILVVPVFEKHEYDEGYWSTDFIRYDDYTGTANQFIDKSFNVGDDLSILQIQPEDSRLAGALNIDTLRQKTSTRFNKIRIGAIIYERVMWFEDASQPPTAYTLIGTKSTLDSLSIEPTFSRTQIYLDKNVDYDDFEPVIHKYQKTLQNFKYQNNAVEMRDYRQFLFYLKGICLFMISLSVCISLTIVITYTYILYLRKQKRNNMLRIIGVTPWTFIKVDLKETIWVFILASLMIISTCCIVIMLMFGSTEVIGEYLNVSVLFVLFVVACLVLAIVKLLIMLPTIKKFPKL